MSRRIDDYIEREEAQIMQDYADGLMTHDEMRDALNELYAFGDDA